MIRIRPARPDDIDVLAGIGLAAWKKAIKPLVTADLARRIEGENPLLSFLRDQGSGVLVAEYGGIPVGLGATDQADNNISDIWISPVHEARAQDLR